MKGMQMQMPDISLKREYVIRLPVAILRYQRKRTRYASERVRERDAKPFAYAGSPSSAYMS